MTDLPAISADGFLLDAASWTPQVGERLAHGLGISLTDAHWEVLDFLRRYFFAYHHLPNTRMFVKAVQGELGPEKGNSAYLHRLFPDFPLKYACLIAGLPKPPGCL